MSPHAWKVRALRIHVNTALPPLLQTGLGSDAAELREATTARVEVLVAQLRALPEGGVLALEARLEQGNASVGEFRQQYEAYSETLEANDIRSILGAVNTHMALVCDELAESIAALDGPFTKPCSLVQFFPVSQLLLELGSAGWSAHTRVLTSHLLCTSVHDTHVLNVVFALLCARRLGG